MKVLRKFVKIAALLLLLTVIVQSTSTSTNTEEEGESRIVKRGLFDCPHDCWGDVSRARARCGNNYREINHPTCCGKCYCC